MRWLLQHCWQLWQVQFAICVCKVIENPDVYFNTDACKFSLKLTGAKFSPTHWCKFSLKLTGAKSPARYSVYWSTNPYSAQQVQLKVSASTHVSCALQACEMQPHQSAQS
jgi:hypothetical protein